MAGKASSKKPATGQKRARNGYTVKDRGIALALLEYNGGKEVKGAVQKTAKMMGIPRRSLTDWSNWLIKETGATAIVVAVEKQSMLNSIEEAFPKIIRSVVRAAEVAAEKGNVQPVTISAAILQDKRADLMGMPVRRYSADTVGQPAVPVPQGTVPEAKDLPIATPAAEQYEVLIQSIMKDADAAKQPLTRDQAIEQLIRFRPEAAKVLQFTPAPEKKTG